MARRKIKKNQRKSKKAISESKKKPKNNNNDVIIVLGGGGKYSGSGDKGKTGVEDRYYKREEFNRLTDAQKTELQEMRQTNGCGSGKRAR